MWTLLNKVTKHWNLLTKYWRQPPLTLIHGDAHLGNVYFRDDGTAGFYDWQLVNANTPLCDVSYFLFFGQDRVFNLPKSFQNRFKNIPGNATVEPQT